jgi:hypothetical protein
MMLNDLMIVNKEMQLKWSWPNLKYYPCIPLERLRIIIRDSRCCIQVSKPSCPGYVASDKS